MVEPGGDKREVESNDQKREETVMEKNGVNPCKSFLEGPTPEGE